MQRRSLAVFVVLFLLGALGAPLSSQAEPGRAADRGGGGGLEVYVGQVDPSDIEKLKLAGLDHEDVATGKAPGGKVAVEVVMNARQASKLAADGVQLSVKKVNGKAASRVALAQNRSGYEGFRSWSEDGGIADELRETAAANPKLAKLVPFGTTVQGQEMLALKVTKNAGKSQDGVPPRCDVPRRPARREWITPEMVRRLMHHFLDNYGTDAQITRLVNTTELWFVPVANPDGYDYTFTGDNRLWRKNLHDNDGDAHHHRQRRRRPEPQLRRPSGAGTTRGRRRPSRARPTAATDPNSEPESQALEAPVRPRRVRAVHQLPLRGRAAALRHRLAGQHPGAGRHRSTCRWSARRGARPCPGYDPDISAELYTTNGDTDSHMTVEFGTLGFTPEMTTCETASAKSPRRRVGSRRLRQRLQLPRRRPADHRGVREEHPVRPVGRRVRRRPGRPRDVQSARRRRTWWPTPSPSRTGPPSRWPSTADREVAKLADALHRQRRSPRGRPASPSGRAASATATPTTTTTPSSAAWCAAPTPGDEVQVRFSGVKPGPGRGHHQALHLHGGPGHRWRRAGARRRGLHRHLARPRA